MYAQQLPDGTWRELRGNVVFSSTVYQTAESLTDEQRKDFNVYQVNETSPPDCNLRYQMVERDGYTHNAIAQQWETSWVIRDKTSEEIAQYSAEMAASIRSKRNAKLSACDWTQLPDAPVDSAAWAVYRQKLRDISSQAGFPWEVVWPQEP